MGKFTPGPWEVDTDYIYASNDNSFGKEVCVVGDRVDWKANGNLIAAAPDLHEALVDAIEWLAKTPHGRLVPQVDGQPGGWLLKAQAALAKARGESNE